MRHIIPSITDYLGSVIAVIDLMGTVEQKTSYYPYGEPHRKSFINNGTTPGAKNRFLFGGKEYLSDNDLNEYFYEPRNRLNTIPIFSAMDSRAEENAWLSPYLFCASNPVANIDPDGNSTRVARNSDDTFRVLGGDLNDDDYNIYVYNQDKNGNYTVKGESIGVTPTMTSFYDSDNSVWKINSIIDPNDNSGFDFLSNITEDTPSLSAYAYGARNDHQYDFKSTNGTQEAIKGIDNCRGMPIGKNINGQTIYTSARDVGNIAAGYVTGVHGLTWFETRLAFDGYQSISRKTFEVEGSSSQNAQKYGWNMGRKDMPFYAPTLKNIWIQLFINMIL